MITLYIKHNLHTIIGKRGFTLVELMIALFVSGLVMATVVSVYIAQTRSYSEQDDIANIQQGLRGALVLLPMDIRLAGCDPTESNNPGIIAATRTRFQFTRDIGGDSVNANTGDGDVIDDSENIAFGLAAANATDTNNNGIVDNGDLDWSSTGSLSRLPGVVGLPPQQLQPQLIDSIADNIEALEFNYILDDGTTSLAPAIPNKIREVQISLLARATNPATGFVNTSTYTTASGVVWNPPDDNFRRRMVVTSIQLRNMGY